MQLFVNPADELPIYRQIMRQIREAVASGYLRPGDKLASHRELAEQLVIAPLTVKKAYDELESEGFLQTQRGRGTFICAIQPRPVDLEPVRASARNFLAHARLAGLTSEQTHHLLRETEQEMSRAPKESE